MRTVQFSYCSPKLSNTSRTSVQVRLTVSTGKTTVNLRITIQKFKLDQVGHLRHSGSKRRGKAPENRAEFSSVHTQIARWSNACSGKAPTFSRGFHLVANFLCINFFNVILLLIFFNIIITRECIYIDSVTITYVFMCGI